VRQKANGPTHPGVGRGKRRCLTEKGPGGDAPGNPVGRTALVGEKTTMGSEKKETETKGGAGALVWKRERVKNE